MKQQKNRAGAFDLRTLTGTGILLGVLLMLHASGLGLLRITPTNVTILQIPVVIATLAFGLSSGLVLGAGFGLASLYSAYTQPNLLSVPFMNPLVSVLPRLLIPLAVYAVARLLRNGSVGRWWKAAVLGAVGSLANTVFVLAMLGLLYGDLAMQVFGSLGVTQGGLAVTLIAYGAVSGLPEAAVSAILSAAVLAALGRMRRVVPPPARESAQ